MLLNHIEYWLMNNPLRAAVQRYHEFPYLRAHSSVLPKGRILEIGCGCGYGSIMIQKFFSPKKICGIDLDKRMIARAKKRNPDGVFCVSDITKLPYENESYDAVIDCGALHHVPNWKDAIREIHRVLAIGGEFIMEDFSKEFFETPAGRITKAFTVHPYEEMYTEKQFLNALDGFKIQHFAKRSFASIEYIVVVAQKL